MCDGVYEGAEFRLLKADHSVLGGVYRTPKEFAGQSIYDIFYLQEAVRCVLRSIDASLLPLSVRS